MSDLRQREFNSLKILHHINRLQTLASGRDIAPVTVEIDPVSYCNHACDWCVDPVHVPVTMSDSLFEALLEELAQFNVNGFRVEGVVFKGGGEPTLHPKFDQMVQQATDLGFAVGVVTNGSGLTRWAGILGAKASYVRVSIDGPTPASHEQIHGSKDFAKILQGVDDLVGARNGRRHPIIGFSFAMDIHTVELAASAIELGEQHGVDYVLLRPPFFEEVGRKPTMSITEAQAVRRQLSQTAVQYKGPLELFVGNWVGDAEQKASINNPSLTESGRRALHLDTNLPIEHRTGRCYASPILTVITADGTLYGCCNLRALPTWALGQLDYENGIGFSEIWESRQRHTILTKMHQTACIQHCTHPLSRYNEIIEVLRDSERPHSQFV